MADAPAQTVDDLGMQGCLALAALLLAQQQHIMVAPTRRMTLELMQVLREHGVIEVPWPEAQWGADPTALMTPVEQLHWRLTWMVYEPAGLEISLHDYLEEFPADEYCLGLRLRVWSDLALGEAECFFAQQLAKHGFSPGWALEMAFSLKDVRLNLSISQWRYCCWAATRKGASIALQQGITHPAVRESILSELRKRVMNVATGAWACQLPPGHSAPESALARCFNQRLARMGRTYWLSAPSVEALGYVSIEA